MSTRIEVASNALGPRLVVNVVVYETLAAMRVAGARYNDSDQTDSMGITQAVVASADGRAKDITVRLARGHLGVRVIGHEMHHATLALYGAQVGDRITRAAHLTHYNEPLAYLFSDMLGQLVDELYQRGYYDVGGGMA